MPTIVDLFENSPFSWKSARVYYSETLKDREWLILKYVHLDRLRTVCGPEIDTAQFSYQTGDFAWREDSPHTVDDNLDPVEPEAVVCERLDLNRKYCKVEFLNEFGDEVYTWRGKFLHDDRNLARGSLDPTGTQAFYAYGLAVELDETIVRSAKVRNYDDTTTRTINRGLPFNYVEKAGGNALRGNKEPSGRYFSDVPFSDETWTATDALIYLLDNFPPKGAADAEHCQWEVVGEVLDWYDISVETDRRSVKAIVDELVDRRRLAGYWVESYEAGPDVRCRLKCFTFTDVTIATEGGSIPENTDTVELQVGLSPAIYDRMVRTVQTHRADVVRVEGARITSVFSLEFASLAIGWTPTNETEYLDGAGGDDEEANTIARSRDKLKDVFARFIVDEAWDRLSRDTYRITADPAEIAMGITDADVDALFVGGVDESPLWFRGARFENFLTIKDPDTDEFVRPFVVFPNGGESEAYVFADQASVGERNFACSLTMLHDRLGFILHVNHSGGQSLLAKNHWAGAEATPDVLDPDAVDEAFDYEDLIITATLKWDDYVAVSKRITTDPPAQEKTVIIHVPDARLDFEIPGTVTDLDSDGALVESTGKVLRDDRNRLDAIAEASAQWYGTGRLAIELGMKSIVPWVTLGQFVTKLVDIATEEGVNTPITGITYNFVDGSQVIETSYAQVDFT